MKSNILISGGCGFIASNIAEKICKKHNVRIVDNLLTGSLNNIAGFRDKVDLTIGDLKTLKVCDDVTKDIDTVLHLAALPSVPRSIDNPRASNENNVSATVNLLKASVDNGVNRVIFSSSSSVYGDTKRLPKVESMIPRPKSPYATSKVAGEYYMKAFAECYDIDTVSLRYFNIFGKRQAENSPYAAVIPKFMKAVITGEQAIVHGDAKQSRDFSHVDNVINANMLAAKCKDDLNGDVINVACGGRHTLLDLIDTIDKVSGKEINYIKTDFRPGDVKHSQADITKAKNLLGYEPKVGFEEGIKKTFKYYKGVFN